MSAIAALAVSLILVVVRLVTKDTVKHAFSGVFGVAFGVVFAMMTGNAKDFYLPGMLYTLGLGLAYIITTLCGVPLIGLILGPVFKENLSWRTRNPGRKKAYAKASFAWGAILLAKCAILFPLYWWADTAQLGWVLVGLKIPLPARRLADLGLPGEGPGAHRRVRGDGGGREGGGGAQGGTGRGARRDDRRRPAPARRVGRGLPSRRGRAPRDSRGALLVVTPDDVSSRCPRGAPTAGPPAAPRGPGRPRRGVRRRPPGSRPGSGSGHGCRG